MIYEEGIRRIGNQAARLSNEVASGDCGFVESLNKLIQAYGLEAQICSKTDGDDPGFWAEQSSRLRAAIEIYNKEVLLAEKNAVEKLRQAGMEDVADALDDGDCSGLAY